MEIRFFQKSAHERLRRNPELAKTEEFWRKISPETFLEEDPHHALAAAGEAIRSGIDHPNLRKIVNIAVRTQSLEDVAKAMGAEKSRRVAEYIVKESTGIASHKIRDEQIARALVSAAPPEKVLDIIAAVENDDIREKILGASKKQILSSPKALTKIAKHPEILAKVLEMEWHGEMNVEQLMEVSKAMSAQSGAKLAKILSDVLQNDIRSPKAAKNTVILIKNILSGAASNKEAAEGLLRVYDRIKSHVFTPEGTRKEFGKEFIKIAGEDAVIFLAKAARNKQLAKKYDEASKLLWEATWLAKEIAKHSKDLFSTEKDTKKTQRISLAMLKITSPGVHAEVDHRTRMNVHRQLARMLEYAGKNGLMDALDPNAVRRIGENLAKIHAKRAIVPVLEQIASGKGGKNHSVLLNAYVGAHDRAEQKIALQEALEEMEMARGRELNEEELKRIVDSIRIKNYVPAHILSKIG